MSNQEISGFFISFTAEESDTVRRRLDLYGYPPDGEGLKRIIMERLLGEEDEEVEFESPTDRVIRSATEYLHTNPETVLNGINLVKNISSMIKKNIGRKK